MDDGEVAALSHLIDCLLTVVIIEESGMLQFSVKIRARTPPAGVRDVAGSWSSRTTTGHENTTCNAMTETSARA